MIKPVSGYTLIEVETVGGSELITASGEAIGSTKLNKVVAVSKKDANEWKVGDKITVGENAGMFTIEEGEKKYYLLPNSAIIAIL